MALSINPATKVISVPKADLILVTGTLYELDTNQFRKNVMALLDDENYIWMDNAFTHNTAVTIAGTTIARTIEFINGWSVEFEDGAYSVRLAGSNNNIFDVENGILVQNSVQVIAQNSAGLVESQALQYADYDFAVTIDTVSGEAGTDYPIGTLRRPVDNIPDAVAIASSRGFGTINVVGNLTLDTGDNVTDYIICGQNPNRTTITVNTGAVTNNCEFKEVTLTGILDGGSIVRDSVINTLTFLNGTVRNSMINAVTITLGGGSTAHFLDCFSGVPGVGTPTIDMGGSGQNLGIRGYNGGIKIQNMTGASDNVSLDINSGQVILDSTCTDGTIVARGLAALTDNSVGATVNSTGLLEGEDLKTVRKVISNRLTKSGTTLTIYDDDGVTPLYTISPYGEFERGALA